jgi:CBS domain-containing protein
VVAEGLDPLQTPLREVMSGEPVFLSEGRGIGDLVSNMRDLGVRRVPIVDRDGQLKGIIALDDLVVLLADQLSDLAQTIRRGIEAPD